MGDRDQAFAHLEELIKLSGTEDLPRLSLAIVHIGLGELERAFELLEEGYAQRDSNLLYLQCESAFDPLRDDPRFHDPLRRMNLEP